MLGTSMVVATIPVTDLDRARHFYGETLRLTFLWDNPASVRFGCGAGTELSIFRRGPSTADHTVAHFEVSDIANDDLQRLLHRRQLHSVPGGRRG